MLLKSCLGFTLIAFLFLLGHTLALERKKTEIKGITKTEKGKKTKNSKPNKDAAVLRKSRVINTPIRNEPDCTEIGGICQEHTYICQGRYLKNLKCSGAKKQQCCVPAAWDVLCAGTHQNRVRACDRFGCGGFNTKSDGALHKAVDVVCDDFGIINAPFSGILGGPVGRKVGVFQYDGIKLSNSVHCVKIFNVRPYRYTGPIGQGQALGYLLPIQESFSGITSHLELQMCDQSDPTPFI
ncbi:leukocyte cell-derived chemotaxin-2-like [Hoplias malabaricus]|uniref:leukocyte cell-derived chemotaxin-2-like n=1 Tax=Hoplias malabaricus TaxID=27720 RepID=UPI003461DF58